MRINTDPGSQPLPQSDRPAASKLPAEIVASPGSTLGQDHAQLSAAGAQVAALTAEVLQLPEVRHEKVQSLRQVVQAGAYAPNPEAVAAALLNHLAARAA